jgi:signal transduction histidine kinase
MDLTGLVRDVVTRFRENAIYAGAHIEIRARGPAVGSWDADRLDQVLTNLLSNALKFAPGLPIVVEVESLGDRVRVGVRDRGPGIDADDRQRIFDRFEQTRTAEGAGGIGLGLWIARAIVRGHGGEITVESEPGQGAVFWVELPR